MGTHSPEVPVAVDKPRALWSWSSISISLRVFVESEKFFTVVMSSRRSWLSGLILAVNCIAVVGSSPHALKRLAKAAAVTVWTAW